MKDLTFIDLFAGIGGIRIAFENVGGQCVFSSEWDESAQKTYEAFFGEKPTGDITTVKAKDIPDHTILTGGFPCQAFSIMGYQKGFEDTRGTLFFEIERILRVKKPEAFLLENVRRLTTHDDGRTFAVIQKNLKKLGYHVYWNVFNALGFGLPQKRERVVIVGFKKNYPFQFPEPSDTYPALDQFLQPDEDVDKKYFAAKEIRKSVMARVKAKGKKPFYPSIWHENKSGNIGMHPFSCALRAGASYNYLLVNGKRRLTEREQLRLQGFPKDFPVIVSYTQMRKQTGNSVPIPMIQAIAAEMVRAMKKKPMAAVNGLKIMSNGVDPQLCIDL